MNAQLAVSASRGHPTNHLIITGGVGKSCLTGQTLLWNAFNLSRVLIFGTAQFVHNEWIESYDPTIEDSYRTQLQVDVSLNPNPDHQETPD